MTRMKVLVVLIIAMMACSEARSVVSTSSITSQVSTTKVLLELRGGRTTTKSIAITTGKGISSKQPLPEASHHAHELMSPVTAVANVLADLCPHGMLPLAYGLAAAGGTGPVLGIAIVFLFGFLSWYSLLSFARAAEVVLVQANAQDIGESLSAVWARTLPNGKATSYIPDIGCFLLTVGCLLFYSAFIGDLFGSLASGLLPTSVPEFLRTRSGVLLLLHAVPILPLCLKKDLSALKYSSMTGLVGLFYTIFFVGKRLGDASYATGGQFHDLMPIKFQPAAPVAFPSSGGGFLGFISDMPPFHAGKGLLILMNMCCVAFACHYNAVKYYMELKQRTVPAFGGVMACGIGGTGLVFLCMMILGYGTFGAHSQALLLNNYHKSDVMATVARAFTGLAIISGYPLMFAGLKASLFSLLKLDGPGVEKRDSKQNTISAIVVAAIAVGACFVTEHELATVIGIVGSIFGSVVIYMFPAFVSNSLLKMTDAKGNKIAKPFFRGEALFNKLLVLFGIIFAILGTWISLAGEEH